MPFISVSPSPPVSSVTRSAAAALRRIPPPVSSSSSSSHLTTFLSTLLSFSPPSPQPSPPPPLPAQPTILHYNALLHSLSLSSHPNHTHAYALFSHMLSNGVRPNAASFTILLKTQLLDSALISSAYNTIQSMIHFGISPDSITYSTLIAGLCRLGRTHEALGVLDVMLEENCTPTLSAYTSIVHGYCLERRIGEAKRFLSTMEEIGSCPDAVTYSAFIGGLCEIGEFDEVERVLEESGEKGWKPNEVTFNIYMSGLCRSGRVDDAFRQLEVMRSNGLCPTMESMNILFDCLCREGKVWEAKELLERSGELNWEVDLVFYNTLMSRLCKNGSLSSVLKLLTDMVKTGFEPNICTFTVVIRSLCMAGKFRKAKCIIKSDGFVADVVAFNTLMHWFRMEGMVDEVRQVFEMMAVERVMPNKFTYCMMIDSLCIDGYFTEAIKCCLGSLKEEFLPDLVCRLSYWLVKSRKLREILYLFEEVLGRGLVVDARIFNSLIWAFCSNGYCQSAHLYKVCLILDRMLGLS